MMLWPGGVLPCHLVVFSWYPAINAAPTCAGLTTDQRGYTRVAPCDIGAFEYGAVP